MTSRKFSAYALFVKNTSLSALRSALCANAIFSILTGIPLVFATHLSTATLGFKSAILLKLFGLSLLAHAVILFWAQKQDTIIKWTRVNLPIVALYPVLILILILTGQISGQLGTALAGADGLIVGLIAFWQYRAMKSLAQSSTI